MSKQTAVNWLIDKIYFERVEVNRELLDKAIEMEKQQIENAFCKGFLTEGDLVIICQQYIEETFNK
jgi:hypothetical protein